MTFLQKQIHENNYEQSSTINFCLVCTVYKTNCTQYLMTFKCGLFKDFRPFIQMYTNERILFAFKPLEQLRFLQFTTIMPLPDDITF